MALAAADGTGEQPLLQDAALSGLHSCSWSPDGEWIACAKGNLIGTVPGPAFGNIAPSGIVVLRSSGGPVVKVTDDSGSNTSPVWANDGRHLYFVSNREGPRDIYVVEVQADGSARSAPRRITTGLGLHSVAFAAAGNRLVYVTYAARSNIWSLPIPTGAPVETSQAKALTSSNQIVEAMRVSPDRKWLLFDSTLHLNAEIFRMPVTGGPIERLTTEPSDDFAPDLSPDGRELLFHSWRSGTRDIYLKPIDGSAQALTSTPAQESYPRWSPDGRALVYYDQTYSREGLTLSNGYLMRRDARGSWSAPVELVKDVGLYGDWVDEGTGWAANREDTIFVVPVSGGAPRTLYTAAPGSNDPRVFSLVRGDDDRTLYFKSLDAQGQPTIWSISTSGGKPRLLVRFSDPSRASIRGDFAVGAGRIFFALEERQADIWVADISVNRQSGRR
jgi:TolB protein